MKTIKTCAFIILLLLVSNTLSAAGEYYKGDTIRYKFDKMLVQVASNDYVSESPEKTDMADHIKQLQKVIDGLKIISPAEGDQVSISYHNTDGDLTVWNYKELDLSYEKKNAGSLLVFDDGTIFEKEPGRYCISLLTKSTDLKIYVDDLSDLAFFYSGSFEQKAHQGTESVRQEVGESYRRSPVHAWVDLRGEEPKVYIQESKKALDMLMLSGGIGSGWVKNTFVSDINFRLGFGIASKGMIKNIYSVEWDMMYDFSKSDENNFFDLNHFVSLGWEHNFSNSPLEDKWYGFSVGYLVKRNNDFFKENTFRVSVKKKINDTISLKPELYFNGFLKNVYPGIRVSVAF